MKRHKKNDSINFDILGIGKSTPRSAPANRANVRQEEEQLEFVSFINKMSAPVEPVTEDENIDIKVIGKSMSSHGFELIEPHEIDAGVIVDGIRKFRDSIVTSLEEASSSLGLQTSKLAEAGLGVAIYTAFFEMLGLVTESPGKHCFKDMNVDLYDHLNDYRILHNISEYGVAEVRRYLTSDDSEVDGFDSAFENRLFLLIGERTMLPVEDAITITETIAETWCEQDDNKFWKTFSSLLDEDDDDEDDVDGFISIELESGDGEDCDCLTVTGLDGRSLTFFINFDELAKAGYGENVEQWSWLTHMMPALVVKTSKNAKTFLDCNCPDFRFVILDDSTADWTLALYTFEEGTFDPSEPGSKDLLTVLDNVFSNNVDGTALSQCERVLNRVDYLEMSESSVAELLEESGIDIHINEVEPVDEKDEPEEDDGEDEDNGEDLEVDGVNDDDDDDEDDNTVDLSDIGCQVADTLRLATVNVSSETDKVETVEAKTESTEPAGDLVLQPIRRNKNKAD